jgi:hypothetical protein
MMLYHTVCCREFPGQPPRCRRIGMGCVSTCGDDRDALGPSTSLVKFGENIKARSTNTNQTLDLRAWVPVTRQQEHPQVSVNRCGRHVIHCAEHRITYLARADFIVKYGQTETRCCALSYGTSSSHQLDNLSFVLDYFR